MKNPPTHIYSPCPACSERPTVEVYASGEVRIGEGSNVVALAREEWHQLVRAIQRGDLGELVEPIEPISELI